MLSHISVRDLHAVQRLVCFKKRLGVSVVIRHWRVPVMCWPNEILSTACSRRLSRVRNVSRL